MRISHAAAAGNMRGALPCMWALAHTPALLVSALYPPIEFCPLASRHLPLLRCYRPGARWHCRARARTPARALRPALVCKNYGHATPATTTACHRNAQCHRCIFALLPSQGRWHAGCGFMWHCGLAICSQLALSPPLLSVQLCSCPDNPEGQAVGHRDGLARRADLQPCAHRDAQTECSDSPRLEQGACAQTVDREELASRDGPSESMGRAPSIQHPLQVSSRTDAEQA